LHQPVGDSESIRDVDWRQLPGVKIEYHLAVRPYQSWPNLSGGFGELFEIYSTAGEASVQAILSKANLERFLDIIIRDGTYV
jgi:hypothetical protein